MRLCDHTSMASSALRRVACTVFIVALGVSLSGASPHRELKLVGLGFHTDFSLPVDYPNDPETLQKDYRMDDGPEVFEQPQGKACELNITESGSGLHEVKAVAKRSFSFFLRPEGSFKKLVFKMNLQNIFSVSGDFYSDEEIMLSSEALAQSGGKQQWTRVRVDHYKYERRGFDRHGFKVSFGNTTLTQVAHDAWVFKGFKGFAVFAEGAAQVLFNCDPSNLEQDQEELPMRGYVFYSMWVMTGLVIVASFLLASLCIVWAYLRQQKKKKQQAPVSPIKYPVYEEFDEVVLEKIRHKVEALRSGKTVSNADTVVVDYTLRQDNVYELPGSGYEELQGVDPADHHYEDIDKDFLQQLAKVSEQQNRANTENPYENTYAADNIYDTLPRYEECVQGWRDTAVSSTRGPRY